MEQAAFLISGERIEIPFLLVEFIHPKFLNKIVQSTFILAN